MRFYKFFISGFILLTFITRTIGPPSTVNRLTAPDFFGLLALIFFLFGFKKINVPPIQKSFLFLIISFGFGLFVTENLSSTVMELLVLTFLFLLFTTIITVYRNEIGIKKLFLLVAKLTIIAGVIGIYDFFTRYNGLPRIFPYYDAYTIVLISGFRNGGQAGAFFLVTLAVLIPLKYSKLYNYFSYPQKQIISAAVWIGIISLLLTVKVIAYIGFFISIFCFVIFKRKWNFIFYGGILTFIIVINFKSLEYITPAFYNRLNFKIANRITDNLKAKEEGTELSSGGKFVEKNFGTAINVFLSKPLTGSGIGGFVDVHAGYEVHSTYFKIIGETGIIGIIGFSIFLGAFFKLFYLRRFSKKNPYRDFLSNVIPFVLGFLAIWIYNYPLRKREFWIFLAVICIANKMAKRYELKFLHKKLN